MGGQYELKDGATKKYYSIAGMTVATKDASGLQYLLTDHLGSTVAVTNASGTLTSQSRYLPFGGVRSIPNSPILSTDFGYTGQRLLDAGMGGIMDYKARFYSVALGRFIQPDSIIPDQSNPQSWNRLSYVRNSPIRYSDPTGHMEYEDPYESSTPIPPPVDDDEILSEPDDESDSCTSFSTCIPDCSDGRWECATDVSWTLEDWHTYAFVGVVACLGTGVCEAIGAAALSGLENIGWQALRACASVLVCLELAKQFGIYFPTNDGFAGNTTYTTLRSGQIITRYGDASGAYASPIGTPFTQRAIPFHQWNNPLTGYQVIRPFGVTTGVTQPFYGLQGGGIQYWFRQPIQYYIDNGFLEVFP